MAQTADKNKGKKFKQFGLRGTLQQEKVLDLATKIDAEKRGSVVVSRNEFCLTASLDRARQVILDAGQKVPGE